MKKPRQLVTGYSEDSDYITIERLFTPNQPFDYYEFWNDRYTVKIYYIGFKVIIEKKNGTNNEVVPYRSQNNDEENELMIYFDDKIISFAYSKEHEFFRMNYDHYIYINKREVRYGYQI